MSHIKYRPDIDGLRAIAVISVILFHANLPNFNGGFIGVDIFFVISGYLIGSIIFTGLDSGTFSFSDFYLKRVKRIFPSLIVVLIATYLLGLLFLFPDELTQLGRHLVAGVGFFSNLQLWSEVGYFDNSSDKKPLLHLWSLAIEEQFYIFAPLLFYAFSKYLKKALPYFIFLLITISFYYSVWTLKLDITKSFYSPLSRFWEILIGCQLAIFEKRVNLKFQIPELLKTALSTVVSILAFYFLYKGITQFDKKTAFPGINALIPTLATCAIIFTGKNSYLNKWVLGSKPFVYIGKISYPMYLWHWMFFSFFTILSPVEMSLKYKALFIALTFILGDLTFRLIEKPLRFNPKINSKVQAQALIASMIFIGAIGGFTEYSEGLSSRFNDRVIKPQLRTFSSVNFENEKICKEKFPFAKDFYCGLSNPNLPPSVMVLGDSHSRHFFHGLKEYYQLKNQSIVSFGKGGCPPFLDVTVSTDIEKDLKCNVISKSALSFAQQDPGIKTIILAAAFEKYTTNPLIPLNERLKGKSNDEIFEKSFEEMLLSLSKLDKRIVVLLQIPQLQYDPKTCLNRLIDPFNKIANNCQVEQAEVNLKFKSYISIIEKIKRKIPTVEFFSTEEKLCDKGICKAVVNKSLLYSDDFHLNMEGSLYFSNKFNF